MPQFRLHSLLLHCCCYCLWSLFTTNCQHPQVQVFMGKCSAVYIYNNLPGLQLVLASFPGHWLPACHHSCDKQRTLLLLWQMSHDLQISHSYSLCFHVIPGFIEIRDTLWTIDTISSDIRWASWSRKVAPLHTCHLPFTNLWGVLCKFLDLLLHVHILKAIRW